MWRLAVRVVVLFAVIIGFCVALGAYMNYSSVRTAYLGAIHSRLQVVADGIRHVIETAQSLGIGLAAQPTLTPLLKERHQVSPLLLSIDVYNTQHRVLYSSAPARVGSRLSATAIRNGTYREVEPVVNNLGLTTGGLLLRFDRKLIDQKLNGLAWAVLDATLPALFGALAIGCGGVMLLLIRLRRQTTSADDLVARNPTVRAAIAEITAAHERLSREPPAVDPNAAGES